jgi:DNA-binding NarL/FixJ family response regulator
MPGDVIRIVLVDDHSVVRAGLKAVLKQAPDISVVGEASNGKEALLLAERVKPDVVIMDLSMPDMDGAAATKAIVASGVSSKILVLTMHAEDEYLLPLLEAGASGYLVKSAADTELVNAIRAVAHGDSYVSSAASNILIKGLRKKDPAQADHDRFNALTQRERDVLRLVAHGYSAPEIGEQLFISPKTVDTYKQRINEKLGISHRSEYVDFALRVGILGGSSSASSA